VRYDLIRRVLVVVVAGLLFSPAVLFSQKQKPSPPRSVQFTSISGSVTVTPAGATVSVPAQMSTPILEGAAVSTLDGGVATIKLENGSTIEFDELTQATFTKLSADASGNKLNVITLEKGNCQFHLDSDSGNSNEVKIADASISPAGNAKFQASFILGKMQVRVLTGSVIVSAHSASLTLGKGKSMEYRPTEEAEVATSHVRAVRLSFVSGTVMLRRPGMEEAETATLNTPIQEGYELSTSSDDFAEVEFENGSTARLGEQSKLLFHQLALDAKGNKLNGLTFEQGYATFRLLPERAGARLKDANGAATLQNKDVYVVKFADADVTADAKCEFRADFDRNRYRVEVFSGSVNLSTPAKSIRISEGKILENMSDGTEASLNVKGGIVKDDWDHWTDARDRQALLTPKDESVHPVGPSYGWGDLNTYGEWVSLSGGRFGWSPYAGAGWSPYSNGYWNWFSGFGWTWVPAEPWGWLTDHCGAWDFDSSFGWYWMNPMFGCGTWYPSLVNWYGGPGWIGWRPRGPGHRPPGLPPHGGPPVRRNPGAGSALNARPALLARQIVTVPTAVIQNRQMITPQIVNRVEPTAGSLIERPTFESSLRTISPTASHPMNPGAASANPAITATAAPTAAHAGGTKQGFANHAAAPPTILMGGNAAIESALLANHSFNSGRQPLRAIGGTTLGGHFDVHASPGEARGHTVIGIGANGAATRISMPASTPNAFHAAGGSVAVVPHGQGGNSSRGGFSPGIRSAGGSSSGGHAGGGGSYSSGGGHSGGSSGGGGGMSGGGGHSSGGGGGGGAGGGGGGHH
jgi:ferric-dicitrate binding protein FerR (iron transport regulator)